MNDYVVIMNQVLRSYYVGGMQVHQVLLCMYYVLIRYCVCMVYIFWYYVGFVCIVMQLFGITNVLLQISFRYQLGLLDNYLGIYQVFVRCYLGVVQIAWQLFGYVLCIIQVLFRFIGLRGSQIVMSQLVSFRFIRRLHRFGLCIIWVLVECIRDYVPLRYVLGII